MKRHAWWLLALAACGSQGPAGGTGASGTELVWLQGDGGVIGPYAGGGVFLEDAGCVAGLSYVAPFWSLSPLINGEWFASQDCSGAVFIQPGQNETVEPWCFAGFEGQVLRDTGAASLTVGSFRGTTSDGGHPCVVYNGTNPQPLDATVVATGALPAIAPPFTIAEQ